MYATFKFETMLNCRVITTNRCYILAENGASTTTAQLHHCFTVHIINYSCNVYGKCVTFQLRTINTTLKTHHSTTTFNTLHNSQ